MKFNGTYNGSISPIDSDGSIGDDVGIPGPQGPQGPRGPAGEDGKDGQDGISPTIFISTITGGHRITITDVDGPHEFNVMDGEDGERGPVGPEGAQGQIGPQGPKGDPGLKGENGINGFSPTINVSSISGGHRVTITDSTGPHSFDVLNGINGVDGEKGETGPKGDDLPIGTIVIWYGTSDDVPDGWHLCDGTENTPEIHIVGYEDSQDITNLHYIMKVETVL